MLIKLKPFWQVIRQNLRQLSGEDAYERYLARFAEHQKMHAVEMNHLQHAEMPSEMPLSREDFFKQWQDNKWTGVKRCC